MLFQCSLAPPTLPSAWHHFLQLERLQIFIFLNDGIEHFVTVSGKTRILEEFPPARYVVT